MTKTTNWKISLAIVLFAAFLFAMAFMFTAPAEAADCDAKNDPAEEYLKKAKDVFLMDEFEVADGVCVWRWLDHPAR